jgi:hypothetical protein
VVRPPGVIRIEVSTRRSVARLFCDWLQIMTMAASWHGKCLDRHSVSFLPVPRLRCLAGASHCFTRGFSIWRLPWQKRIESQHFDE